MLAAVATRWISAGNGMLAGLQRPALDDLDVRVRDVTMTPSDKVPPTPNILIVIADLSADDVLAISADLQHGATSILPLESGSASDLSATGFRNHLLLKGFNTSGVTYNGDDRTGLAMALADALRGLTS